MNQKTLLISGPPGCGKTSWILSRLRSHRGPCGYLRLAGAIDQRGITTITCLGDLVGYGPQPNEVVNLVRQRGIPSCQGCWDEDIIEGLNACDCSYPSQLAERRGHLAHQWTAEQLSEENRCFLASLPRSLRRDRLLFVHGSPNSQHEYLLPDMDAFAALERVESAGAETLFCGHTHQPYVRELRNGSIRVRLRQASDEPAGMDDAVERTCRAIVDAGLPPIFAWRSCATPGGWARCSCSGM